MTSTGWADNACGKQPVMGTPAGQTADDGDCGINAAYSPTNPQVHADEDCKVTQEWDGGEPVTYQDNPKSGSGAPPLL